MIGCSGKILSFFCIFEFDFNPIFSFRIVWKQKIKNKFYMSSLHEFHIKKSSFLTPLTISEISSVYAFNKI